MSPKIRVETVNIEKFNDLSDITIDLDRVNVLTGRRNAGQETLINLFSFTNATISNNIHSWLSLKGLRDKDFLRGYLRYNLTLLQGKLIFNIDVEIVSGEVFIKLMHQKELVQHRYKLLGNREIISTDKTWAKDILLFLLTNDHFVAAHKIENDYDIDSIGEVIEKLTAPDKEYQLLLSTQSVLLLNYISEDSNFLHFIKSKDGRVTVQKLKELQIIKEKLEYMHMGEVLADTPFDILEIENDVN